MVKYALTQYHANTDRVYCSGDSSGGMTTQLMLALYPDVYKAGSSFAGVPAGCSNAFDGAGLCGFGAQTAQQWGDRVRAMNPGYTGHRPRVQLFHGDADATIEFPNHGESIKEWTNVLALAASRATTDTGLSLGNHQATRQRWKNQGGFVTLDAFTSIGGAHGPSDALFEADYVVPFLGLDDTGEVDPEVKQCNGAGGSGGAAGAGGSAGAAAGGTAGTGGAVASGGSTNVAGSSVGGGSESGGNNANAGAPGVAGNVASAGSATGGAGGVAGQSTTLNLNDDEATADTSGCTCQLGAQGSHGAFGVVALVLGIASARRRRRVA